MELVKQVDMLALLASKLEREHTKMSREDFTKAVRDLVERIRDLQMHFGS